MELYAKNLREGEKSIHFQNKKAHNLETPALEGRNTENFLLCHPKLGRVYTKMVETEKHIFAANKEA